MRIVQVLAFGAFAAVLVVCGACALAWFGTSSPPPNAIQDAPEPKSASAIIHLNSHPQDADATASLGWSCRTPCSIELSVDAPFTVTFTRRGFAPSIIPVQIERPQTDASEAKFAPDPVFAALQPVPPPEAKNRPRRAAASPAAPPSHVHEATSSDGLISRSWKYLEQKAQAWQMQLGRLIPTGGSR
jgi:hypothetical protein